MSIGREPTEVVVITGTGGMGIAIARRLGPGRQLVLADYAEGPLESAATLLRGEGHWVSTKRTDVSCADDVATLASFAAGRGRLVTVVHTAGVSPVQATADRVVSVDLIGTAYLLDAFVEHAQPGMTVVCIASMAGAMIPLPPELEQALAKTPSAELAALPFLDPAALDPQGAYPLAKRANQLRVQAMAGAYGAKGARVVSISPGVVSTPMGQAELGGPAGDMMRAMVEGSAAARLGTPDDIANAVALLTSAEASFITGIDLLVDGGVIAATRWR